MAITLVQSKGADAGTVTSTTLAFTSNVTSGNFLFTAIRSGGAGTLTNSASDNLNGSWTQDLSHGNTLPVGTLSANSFANTAGGSCTVTATQSASATLRLIIEEWSGIATSSPLDKTAQADGTTATASSGATATTTQANELVLGVLMGNNDGTPTTATAGTGYTMDSASPQPASSDKTCVEYQVVSSTGAQTATFSLSTTDHTTCFCLTYKAAAAATAPFVPIDISEPIGRRSLPSDFAPPNLLTLGLLKLPPFTQREDIGRVQWKGVYTDFQPPNLLADKFLPPPPIPAVDLSQYMPRRWAATDFNPPNLLTDKALPPPPVAAVDLSQRLQAKWVPDFQPPNLLADQLLPSPPVQPQDWNARLYWRGIFNDFLPENLTLSTLATQPPFVPQDIFGIRLSARDIRDFVAPNLNTSTLTAAAPAPIIPQDPGLRLDIRPIPADFIPPNLLTGILPFLPPTPTIIAAGRHKSRAQAHARHHKDVLRARVEAFKEQRRAAEQALIDSEDREVKARTQVLKRVRVKGGKQGGQNWGVLPKPVEQYAAVKRAIETRVDAIQHLRTILRDLARAQQEYDRELDEEAALHFMHFLMWEADWPSYSAS